MDSTDPQAIAKVQIKSKSNKPAFIMLITKDKKDKYVKAESKFCKQAYIDYCCAFTKVARERTKEALETQRRLFAEIQHYGPSSTNVSLWIYKPNMENIRA